MRGRCAFRSVWAAQPTAAGAPNQTKPVVVQENKLCRGIIYRDITQRMESKMRNKDYNEWETRAM